MPVIKIELQEANKKLSAGSLLRVAGPILPVRVAASVAPGQPPKPDASDKTVNALIDTGATDLCIDTQLAAQLGLKIIDRGPVGGIKGTTDHDMFLGKVIIETLGMGMDGKLIGIELDPTTPIVIGRDFLQGVVMIYDGINGTVTLAR